MSEETSEDKELPPSERKLQKAREDGSILKAPDLFFLISVMGVMVFLGMTKDQIYKDLLQFWDWNLFWDRNNGINVALIATKIGKLIGFSLVGCIIAGLLSTLAAWALGGFLWNTDLMMPKWNRIDPIQKIKNMVTHLGSSVGWPFLKGMAGLIVGGVGIWICIDDWFKVGEMRSALIGGIVPITLLLVVVAGADFIIQWRKRMHDLGMTLQELKDELKETDGNPEVKARQRGIARQRAQARMMSAVAGADVVVVNPEHFLVAIKWDSKNHTAPIVVAKGLDFVALSLKEEAKKKKIPVLESPPFARALWAKSRLDMPIPVNFFEPVAVLLAWAYAIRENQKVQDPVLEVPKD